MALQSANDAPDRDPKSITLEGSNDDDVTAYDSGNWQLITQIDDIPAWTGRFQTKELFFDNDQGLQTLPLGCDGYARPKRMLHADCRG